MGIDYESTMFFGFRIELDVMYEWMLNEEDDDDPVSDSDHHEVWEWFDNQSFTLGNYIFGFIKTSPYYDCYWEDCVYAFGILASGFDLDDMATLAKYTTLEGYDDLKPVLDALGLHGEPCITSLPNVN